jgi:hypothetical protein
VYVNAAIIFETEQTIDNVDVSINSGLSERVFVMCVHIDAAIVLKTK